ncbi:MAG: beta-ketoacyl synthase [Desulfuromonas sp.]|nr:MAG: beta-ketoacyl synthase [Desulfuromonas sp.]
MIDMRVAIQSIGISGGFGQGVASLKQALQTGRVEPQTGEVDCNGTVNRFHCYRAASEGLETYIPKRALRRIDHYSKLTLYSASLALAEADLLDTDRTRMGVVIATGYGALNTTFDFLDSYLDFGYSCSSPTHFSNSVHNSAAAHVSMQFKLTGPSLTVAQFELSVPSALLTARQWLAEGRVDQVLFGAVDEYCEVLRYCRNRFFGKGEQGPTRPFAFENQSAVVGEGAVFLVLTRDVEKAAYGFIDSVVLGNHVSSPLQLPAEDFIIAGADGHRDCGRWYAETIGTQAAASYSPLYGSFPAAAGFDLAVAALTLEAKQLFTAPVEARTAAAAGVEGVGAISCLKFGSGGDYGLVRLSA